MRPRSGSTCRLRSGWSNGSRCGARRFRRFSADAISVAPSTTPRYTLSNVWINSLQPAYSLDEPQGRAPVVSCAATVRLVIGGVLFFGALFYFAFLAFQGSTVYYLTVDELREQGSSAYGVQNRVSGKLVPDSFEREPQGTLANFALADEGGSHTLARPIQRRRPRPLLQRALGDHRGGQLRPERRLPRGPDHREVPVQVRLAGGNPRPNPTTSQIETETS